MIEKILYLTHHHPLDRSFGGGQRNYLLWKGLSELGVVTSVIATQNERDDFPQEMGDHRFIFARAHDFDNKVSFQRQNFARRLREICMNEKFDLGVARYLSLAWPMLKLPIPTKVVDADDLLKSIYSRSSGVLETVIGTAKECVRRVSAAVILRNFDVIWYVAPKDRWLLPRRAVWLPNSIEMPSCTWFAPVASGSVVRLLTVGDFTYKPNQDGIRWLATEVLSRLNEAHTGRFVLTAVGRYPESLRLEFEHLEGLRFAGYVTDLSYEYMNCAMVLSGVHYGGGSQVKLLEAMAYGCPMVCHSYGKNGFDAEAISRIETVFTDSAPEMVQRILDLVANPGEAATTGRSNKTVVAEKYSADLFIKKVMDSLTL